MSLCSIAAALAVAIAMPNAHAAEVPKGTPAAALRLELALDEQIYAFGQPILLMACLRNVGSAPVDSLPPTREHIDLRLETADGTRLSPQRQAQILTGQVSKHPLPLRGFSLRAGDVQCEMNDLLGTFGSVWPGKRLPVAAAAGEFVLPPGKYRLMAVYSTEGPPRARAARFTVTSDTVGFEIAPLDSFPAEAALLQDFASQGHLEGQAVGSLSPPTQEYARPWLGRFVSSRFFMLAYQLSGLMFHTNNVDSLVGALHAVSAPAVRQAAVIWYQAEVEPRNYDGMLTWLGSMKSRHYGALQEAAAASWELRMRQALALYRLPALRRPQ